MKQILISLMIASASILPSSTQDAATSNKPPVTTFGDVAPMGKLGYSIGTYVTIEGVRAEGVKTGVNTLLVDTLDGKKLDRSVYIWIDNIDSLPKGERCVFNGYESGRWIGTPPDVSSKLGGTVGQAPWQFWRFFLVISAEQPKELKDKFPISR